MNKSHIRVEEMAGKTKEYRALWFKRFPTSEIEQALHKEFGNSVQL